MAYLMKTKQLHLKEAFNDIKQRRHVISPSFGFLDQFLQHESKILSSTPTCRGGSQLFIHSPHADTEPRWAGLLLSMHNRPTSMWAPVPACPQSRSSARAPWPRPHPAKTG
ncbi:hypothetical protein QTO34_005405, partial [Cnephaeus nilssonii]